VTIGWRERLRLTSEPSPDLDLDEERTALLIVDMQTYATPGSDRGAHMRAHAPAVADAFFAHLADVVIPNQRRLLDFWREHGLRVVYLTAGAFLPDGSDLTPRRRRRDARRLAAMGKAEFMHPATSDYQIVPELQPRAGELVVAKNSNGAFNSSPIDQLLQNMGITGLVIVGVITEGCVESTAREAADRGYDCILVEDGCASDLGREPHEATLMSFARMFGEVRSTDEVLDRFRHALAQRGASPDRGRETVA
jgi:biuret amidohydrolase